MSLSLNRVIEAVNLLNETNLKLANILECPVELRMVQPYIGGLYVSEEIIERMRADRLKSVIVEVVCHHFMISPAAITNKKMTRELINARMIAALLMHNYVDGITEGAIGIQLNVSRSTVINARNNAASLVLVDRQIKFAHGQILKQLLERIEKRD